MWSSRPAVRILFFFIIGILLSKYFPVIRTIDNPIIIAISLVLLLASILIIYLKISHRYHWISGLVTGVLIICTGVFISNNNTPLGKPNIDGKSRFYLAKVVSSPTQTNQAIKVVAKVSLIDSNSNQDNKQHKVLCYLAKDSLANKIKYGDLLVCKGRLSTPTGPQNPEEFNYKKFLMDNGIYSTVYIPENNWELVGNKPGNYLIALGNRIRNSLLENLTKNGLSGENYAVASAVLLGWDETMEPELKDNYITAGAMHILCVSGLHVGIIYLVLSFFLNFLKNNRFNNMLAAIIQLLIIWAYATITGLSPSVQRAALMISIFIIGKLTNRHRDTYNTLATSALLVLVIDTNLLTNVGFQLSYAAVLGIVTFHQPIYKLLYFKNTVVDNIWSITVLSFAAQLVTFPIATYYFHFFPTWFWLSNLFTFPLSFLIIASGLLFVITYWIPIISGLIGTAISGLVYLLNYIVGIIVKLPFSGIENIYTSLPMVISLYILILLVYLLLNNKRNHLLVPAVFVFAIIIGLITFHKYEISTQKRIVIYSIRNHTMIELIDGQNQIIFSDTGVISKKQTDYQIKNSRSLWGLSDNTNYLNKKDTITSKIFFAIDDFIYFENQTIFVSNGSHNYHPVKVKYPVDLMVVCGKNETKLQYLNKALDIKKVVIDSSVPPWNRQKIIDACSSLKLQYYDVASNGALIIDL